MGWMDVAIIAIIVISGLNGLYLGLIRSAFNLLGYFIAGYITKLYYPSLSAFIKSNPNILGKIKEWMGNSASKMVENSGANDGGKALEYFKLPNAIKDGIEQSPGFQEGMNDLTSNVTNIISQSFTDIFIDIISILLIFIVSKMILTIIIGFIDNIFRLPLLKEFNKLTGLILGVFKGLLIIYIIFTILTPVIMMSPEGYIAETTYSSNLGLYFYNNNIIIEYLKTKGII